MKLTNVSSKYGAPMGRRNVLPADRYTASPKMRMQKLRWVGGDYDQGGAYWGSGSPGDFIWWAQGWIDHDSHCMETEYTVYVRAKNRTDAKAKVREYIPHARFYR